MIHYYFAVWRKPLLSARGKIIKKYTTSYNGSLVSYDLNILFIDKSIKEFLVSKKQYIAVEKYDVVDITAKGRCLVSLKKQGTTNVIMNKTVGLKEADLIHAKPMPLNNKDTTKYDKWMAKEKKEAEKKAKR